jgi:hypothetical protein
MADVHSRISPPIGWDNQFSTGSNLKPSKDPSTAQKIFTLSTTFFSDRKVSMILVGGLIACGVTVKFLPLAIAIPLIAFITLIGLRIIHQRMSDVNQKQLLRDCQDRVTQLSTIETQLLDLKELKLITNDFSSEKESMENLRLLTEQIGKLLAFLTEIKPILSLDSIGKIWMSSIGVLEAALKRELLNIQTISKCFQGLLQLDPATLNNQQCEERSKTLKQPLNFTQTAISNYNKHLAELKEIIKSIILNDIRLIRRHRDLG